MKDTALKVAGVIFLVVAIAHLLRVALQVEVTIAGYVIPMWVSIWGFVVPLLLAVWMFKSLKALK